MKNSHIIFIVVAALLIAAALFLANPGKKEGNPVKKDNAMRHDAAKTVNAVVAAPDPSLPAITASSVQDSVDNKVKPVKLPYSKPGVKDEKLTFSMSLLYKAGQHTTFRVIPDDCVEAFSVNNHSVMPKGLLPDAYCNWRTGFVIDLQTALKEGENDINLVVRNKSGTTGLKFIPVADKNQK